MSVLKLNDRVRLVKEDQEKDHKGNLVNPGFVTWIAGKIPVGSTGVIKDASVEYPNVRRSNGSYIPLCIVWDHNPERYEGFYWGVSFDEKGFDIID